jgi:hypothetical protein
MMVRVVKTDEDGKKRAYLTSPGDPPGQGVPSMPPPIDALPWEDIKRDIHNLLVEHEVLTWVDLQSVSTPMLYLNPLRRAIIALYKDGGQIP